MNALCTWKTCSLCSALALALPVFAAGPALVVDRGLPQANLNNSTGYRSNVRWSSFDSGFLGDDFALGAAGENWVIDSIRVWTVPGVNGKDPENLGDVYQDVRLYFGGTEGGLTPVSSGLFQMGSSQPSNPNIKISDATAATGRSYEDFGTDMRVWQVDFTELNLAVQGGAKYRFGAFGLGRASDIAGKTNAWFNVATNAELAGAKQDGADGQMLLFNSGGKFKNAFDGKGAGWDKSTDINVQVFAHRVE
jgi:hypothetical protein